MQSEFESRLELAQAKLDEAKHRLSELYAQGASTVHQRRLVSELGHQMNQLCRNRQPQPLAMR